MEQMIGYLLAIEKIGIARSVLYQSLKTPFGVILTLFILGEFLISYHKFTTKMGY